MAKTKKKIEGRLQRKNWLMVDEQKNKDKDQTKKNRSTVYKKGQ